PEAHGVRTHGRRWVDLIARFRLPALIIGLSTAVVLSIPVLKMQLALPDDGVQPTSSQTRKAYDVISEKFGPGTNGPLTRIIDTEGGDNPTAAVNQAGATVSRVKGDVAAVIPQVASPSDKRAYAAYRASLDQYGFATITVVPKSGPSAQETKDL